MYVPSIPFRPVLPPLAIAVLPFLPANIPFYISAPYAIDEATHMHFRTGTASAKLECHLNDTLPPFPIRHLSSRRTFSRGKCCSAQVEGQEYVEP